MTASAIRLGATYRSRSGKGEDRTVIRFDAWRIPQVLYSTRSGASNWCNLSTFARWAEEEVAAGKRRCPRCPACDLVPL